ncbi:uncharacterized protein LOC144434763 [Glandiceps talaboti]
MTIEKASLLAYMFFSLVTFAMTQTQSPYSCGDVAKECNERRGCRTRIEFELSNLVKSGCEDMFSDEDVPSECSFWCNNAFYYFSIDPHPSRKINTKLLTCSCETDPSDLFTSVEECTNFQRRLEPCRLLYIMNDES